jgi:dienelactone hydrolase
VGFALLIACTICASESGAGYDPLAINAGQRAQVLDLVVEDATRSRSIPIRVYLPGGSSAAPVILVSHGLGGSRESNRYLGEHWSARGYVVVVMQHAGSDEGVWKNLPLAQRPAALAGAVNAQTTTARLRDVPAVIDQLERWNSAGEPALTGRLDMSRVGMSGHSFGAQTTQVVSGQRTLGGTQSFTEKRIKAAVIMSQVSPRGGDPSQLFGNVEVPWLLMTGTRDNSNVGNITVEDRMPVFPALPPGGKYELVLDNAEHEAFSDRPRAGSGASQNPNHHRAILAVSTAFWDAWLRQDAEARAWLDGKGPQSVLDGKDRWQRK